MTWWSRSFPWSQHGQGMVRAGGRYRRWARGGQAQSPVHRVPLVQSGEPGRTSDTPHSSHSEQTRRRYGKGPTWLHQIDSRNIHGLERTPPPELASTHFAPRIRRPQRRPSGDPLECGPPPREPRTRTCRPSMCGRAQGTLHRRITEDPRAMQDRELKDARPPVTPDQEGAKTPCLPLRDAEPQRHPAPPGRRRTGTGPHRLIGHDRDGIGGVTDAPSPPRRGRPGLP